MKPHLEWADLSALRVMLVEDEFLLLLDFEALLLEAGVAQVYCCRSIAEAQDCLDSQTVSVAILDFRVGQETVTPIARRLTQIGTPFLFHTGQTESEKALSEWPDAKIIDKPARHEVIVRALRSLASLPRAV